MSDAHHRPAANQQTRRGATERCGRANIPPPTPATRGSEHSCCHPPPSSTPNLQPPLERRLQGGSRRQNVSAVRPKGQDFRLEQDGGRGGRIWKLDPPSRGERHRSAAGVEVDAKSTRGFPRSKSPPAQPRSPDLTNQPPDRREETTAGGRGWEEESRPPLQQDLAVLTPPTRPGGTASTCARHPPEKSTPPSPPRAAALASKAPHAGARQQILAATFTGRRAAAGRLLGWRRGGGRREERRRRLGFGAAPESPKRGDARAGRGDSPTKKKNQARVVR